MESKIPREISESEIPYVSKSYLEVRTVAACAAADASEQETLELIEFRYRDLWARVELEAVFASGLMGETLAEHLGPAPA